MNLETTPIRIAVSADLLATANSIVKQLGDAAQSLSSFIKSCALNGDQKANLAAVVQGLSAQRVAIRLSVEDPHTHASDAERMALMACAMRSIDASRAFMKSPE